MEMEMEMETETETEIIQLSFYSFIGMIERSSPQHGDHSRFSPYPPPPYPIKCYPSKPCCRDTRCHQTSLVIPPHATEFLHETKRIPEEREIRDSNNNNKTEICPTILEDRESISHSSRKSPLHMLVRLFPQHAATVLQNMLTECNGDPVSTIERILDKHPADVTKKELISQMGRSPSNCDINDHYSEGSSQSESKRNIGLNDDQLASIAKAYDIPVNDDKRSNLSW